MSKVLVITVGKGERVEDPILFSIKQQNPDVIYFNASEDSNKEILQQKAIPKISKRI
jgi:hypothetical protein